MAELPPRWRKGLAKAGRDVAKGVALPAAYDALSASQRAIAREMYVEQQAGLCFYCKEPLDRDCPIPMPPIDWSRFPGARGFLKHPVHLHHDHDTGLTLGAVHALCNAVLWQYHGE